MQKQGRLKSREAFIDRLYQNAPADCIDIVANYYTDTRFKREALDLSDRRHFDEEAFFTRLATIDLDTNPEDAVKQLYAFLQQEYRHTIPKKASRGRARQ